MKSQACSRKGSVTPAEVGENHGVTLCLTRCPLFRPGSLDSRKNRFCRILLGSMLESSRIAEANPRLPAFRGAVRKCTKECTSARKQGNRSRCENKCKKSVEDQGFPASHPGSSPRFNQCVGNCMRGVSL